MSGEHTPGKWRVSDRPEMVREHSRFVGVNYDDSPERNGGIWIAEVKGPDCIANAHLIASAPALLEALEQCETRFLEYAESHAAKGTPDADMKAERNREMAATCRAAISLAKGEG